MNTLAPHSGSTSAKPAAPRQAFIDGLRGLLMLDVLLIHVFFVSTHAPGQTPWYNSIGLWFQPGMYAIGLFVAISGYCLMLPLAQMDGRATLGRIPGYLKRRFTRIIPPYYAAAALSLAHVARFPEQYARCGFSAGPSHPGVLWSHLLLVYNFKLDWRFAINPTYWSLAPEWQLYLVFPIVLVPIWRKFGVRGLLAVGLLATAGLMLAGRDALQMHPWFLFLFVAGMAGAVIAESPDPFHVRLRSRAPWRQAAYALVGVVGVEWAALAFFRPALLSSAAPTWQQYGFNETILGLALLASILHWNHVGKTQPMDQWPRALKLLNHRAVAGMGRFSYSHYLVHFPILIAVASVIRSLELPEPATLALMYLVSVPTSLGLGYLFFLAVERRFMPVDAIGKQSAPRSSMLLPIPSYKH